jgi:hypothetical protein
MVLQQAVAMGSRYTEEPPLVQAANVRYKIARLAVALAARTFSHTPEDYENILVTKQHVKDAVWFMDRLYQVGNFGYYFQSKELINNEANSRQMMDQTRALLNKHPGMARFMRTMHSTFRVNDLMEMFGWDRDVAQTFVADLFSMNMVDRLGAHIKIQPALQEILRERDLR